MKILVVGASGFIGRAVIEELYRKGHSVLATYRNNYIKLPNHTDLVETIKMDMRDITAQNIDQLTKTDAVIHLAWDGLPDFKSIKHVTDYLPENLKFLNKLLTLGLTNITVVGTCLEYGMFYGPIESNHITSPVTNYGIAKDTLRKSLFTSYPEGDIKWARLFYVYGPGQTEKSLLPQLNRAIANGEKSFKMSKGDQIRDFIHVNEVAKRLVEISANEKRGVYNVGSGKPVSVREFVEQEMKRLNKEIALELGYYDYPDYEPLAFWAKF